MAGMAIRHLVIVGLLSTFVLVPQAVSVVAGDPAVRFIAIVNALLAAVPLALLSARKTRDYARMRPGTT